MPRSARLVLYVSAFGLLLLLVWAWWAKIDQVTRVSGHVIASARTQVVQTSDGGVLEQLRVKEGDHVSKGQILAVLESSRVQAAVNDTSAKVAALKITLARLGAEVYSRPFVIPPNLEKYREYVRNQTDLFKQRQRALNDELQALHASLLLSKQELDMNQPLLQTGDISRADLLRLQRQMTDVQSQITNRRNRYFQDAQTEMAKAQEDLKTQTEALSERTQLLEHTELLAPTNGIVKNIKLNTLGGVLRAGEELMQILPTESALVVEAKLKPVDVAFVKVGLPVSVKFDAYDYAIFGSLRGKVTYVSADTLSEDTRQGELVYYRIQVSIDEREFKGSQVSSIEMRPGLTASVEIRTGQRSVLTYLTKPIMKSFEQSLSER